jgi:mycothiol synthase
MEIRPYQLADEPELIALWNRCLTRDRVTAEAFRERTLLDPNFDPAGSLVASEAGEPVGFVSAMRRSVAWWGYSPTLEQGWITTLFVDSAHRRRGIGSRLVSEAMAYLQRFGCTRVHFAHFSPHYYFPGVDEEAYPGAMTFFATQGFRIEEQVEAMGRQLFTVDVPPDVEAHERSLAAGGIQFEFLAPRYLLPTLSFFREAFPTWDYFFRRKAAVQPWPEDEMVVAVHGERVIGYCQQMEGEHIGPFGVRPEYRGQGLGTIMLYHLLRRMQEREYRFAWFGMTERAATYYARAGFVKTRTHYKLVRAL